MGVQQFATVRSFLFTFKLSEGICLENQVALCWWHGMWFQASIQNTSLVLVQTGMHEFESPGTACHQEEFTGTKQQF